MIRDFSSYYLPGGLDGDIVVNVALDLGEVHVGGVGGVGRDAMVLLKYYQGCIMFNTAGMGSNAHLKSIFKYYDIIAFFASHSLFRPLHL